MTTQLTRRRFVARTAMMAAIAACRPLGTRTSRADESPPETPRFELTEIAGTPRERGRLYGARFEPSIRQFLDREIIQSFVDKPAPKDEMLRYAGGCAAAIARYSPEIHEELQGLAEGAGIRLEEAVLLSAHEELYHRGPLPKSGHCTAVAIGPPDTAGSAYVGQTWDWMPSVAGLSTMLHWRRTNGPSVLAYAYPGLWIGAGLNSAGLALCWTSASLRDQGARVGIPSYALLTHFLYQDSLDAVAEEARRAVNAGWFTFVMADGSGDLLNVEGSPAEIIVERHHGRLIRVDYGSHALGGSDRPNHLSRHARCQKLDQLITADAGRVDDERLQGYFADPGCEISVGKSTLDLMVYDCTKRIAFVSRGTSYGLRWQQFDFSG